jgi:thioester reductase-like protein
MKNWEDVIESREADITMTNENGKKITKRGQSTWKQELKNIVNYNELLELFDYLTNEMKTDIDKFYNKSNKTAGRRSRNYAQKIKDTMGQIRNVIQQYKPK